MCPEEAARSTFQTSGGRRAVPTGSIPVRAPEVPRVCGRVCAVHGVGVVKTAAVRLHRVSCVCVCLFG